MFVSNRKTVLEIEPRFQFAIDIARKAGTFASMHFASIDSLVIESKGHQDLVSNADKETEKLIRKAIQDAFPDDGIVGEEYARTSSCCERDGQSTWSEPAGFTTS